MTKLGDVNNYHDLTGLQNLKAKASMDPQNKEALKKAAEHFESIFIGMMLKSMRSANAVFEQDNPMNSNTTKFFRDMYDQQLATDMASNGSMGLADIIVEQLSGDNDAFKPASVLRNDADMTRQVLANVSPANVNSIDTKAKNNNPVEFPGLNPMADLSSQPSILSSIQQAVEQPLLKAGLNISNSSDVEPERQPNKAEVNFESPDDFVGQMWSYAKKAAQEIGLNPTVMIAQSALETGWGKHIIKDKNGDSSFNLFNVKAHRDWQGDKAAQSTIEFEAGVAVRKTEPFRVYNNFTESFSDFVNFLKSNQRYEGALNNTKDSEQFLQDLQKAGYATDPNYANKIIGILNSDTFKKSIGKFSAFADSE